MRDCDLYALDFHLKAFTQRRRAAKVAQRKAKEKTLRLLCVSASLRALLFLVVACPRCVLLSRLLLEDFRAHGFDVFGGDAAAFHRNDAIDHVHAQPLNAIRLAHTVS